MYLHMIDAANSNNDYVLSADESDVSDHWKVRNMFVENKVQNDANQQWVITQNGKLYNQGSGINYQVGNDKGFAVLTKGQAGKKNASPGVKKNPNTNTVTVCQKSVEPARKWWFDPATRQFITKVGSQDSERMDKDYRVCKQQQTPKKIKKQIVIKIDKNTGKKTIKIETDSKVKPVIKVNPNTGKKTIKIDSKTSTDTKSGGSTAGAGKRKGGHKKNADGTESTEYYYYDIVYNDESSGSSITNSTSKGTGADKKKTKKGKHKKNADGTESTEYYYYYYDGTVAESSTINSTSGATGGDRKKKKGGHKKNADGTDSTEYYYYYYDGTVANSSTINSTYTINNGHGKKTKKGVPVTNTDGTTTLNYYYYYEDGTNTKDTTTIEVQ
jgi:hypothetical protein